MDNATVTQLENGMYRIIANDGYILHNDFTGSNHSEVIAKTTYGWRSVLNGIAPAPHERTLADAKAEKLAELRAYDASASVNSFSVQGISLWIGPNDRTNYLLTMEAAQEQGVESVPFMGLSIAPAQAIAILKAVSLYAMQCVAVTEQHAANINEVTSIADVDRYDITVGYPEKLTF